MLFRRLITPFAVTACVLSLAACASRGDNSQDRGLLGGVFGGGGQVSDAPEAGIGVNSFLWRSSLEVLSFMQRRKSLDSGLRVRVQRSP